MRRDATTRGAGLWTAATLLALVGTPGAHAQNALGDGRALDANLRQGSGGRNEAPASFRSELQLRNAIVTGNAAGGKSFRGEVGYTAANDFRGLLGSNDLYQFQRDSFYSGLATRNLAGLTALQGSLVYSVAGQSAGYFGGPLIIDRSGAHASVNTATKAPGTAGPIQTDVYGNIAGSMRAPSVEVLRMSDQAETVAVSQSKTPEGERMIVSASPLLGVKVLPATSIVLNAATRYAEPPQPTLGPSTAPLAPEAEGEEGEEPAPPANRVSLPITPHQEILNAIANEEQSIPIESLAPIPPETGLQPPTTPESTPAPEQTPEGQPASPETTTPEGTAPESGAESNQGTPTIPGLEELRQMLGNQPGTGTSPLGSGQSESGTETGTGEANVGDVARSVLGGIELPKIEHLARGAMPGSIYAEHMRKGERLLDEARWFEAEERFTAALGVVPGNALAAAGRVHAQIGAGMYLSAAVNLRNLLRAYPEFIPVRFDEKLLPHGDRLKAIEAQLRQRAERDTPVARDSALLMAYLGHQYDDRALTEEGFKVLDRVESALDLKPTPLEQALHSVWLEGKE